ncbi:MAG TPA: LuxR C-terminal-related transcriptional regulator [Pedococcus sp.]|nr:LuxR C-terminal-related transcriptional regulator [Pedococcus sp.]
MSDPLIATKLYLPKPRRGLVPRPRLIDRLSRGAQSRLTLVSAPAGFGKTTLLSDWLQDELAVAGAVAWLSLEASDNQPASFWTYLVTALRGASPSVGAVSLELATSLPLPSELLLTTLLNELAEASGELWLVLDDYHLVDNPEIGRAMTVLLEHLPPQVHVVVSTRADPDLPLSRWRVRGELVEVRAADLRFTSDEAAAYLFSATGLRLSAQDIDFLEGRTEGWIAALQLAALSLQGRRDVSTFIAQFAGNDRYVVDYLVEEVLEHQPVAVRDFLLESAVLDRMTGPLCDAVTGHKGGSETLLALERANLFIVPLDDRREWFRYHHLFADVLRALLLAQQPEQLPLLHQRASGWYERHDMAQDAVEHAVAARDFDRAARLVELAVPAIRRDRHDATLVGWFAALPDGVIRASPVLSVFFGHMLLASGDLDGVEPRLADAERALAAIPDGSGHPWSQGGELDALPATIAVCRAALAQARGDVAGTAEHARRALVLAGPSDHVARSGAAGFLGFAAWSSGDVCTALEMFAQVPPALHAAGNLVDELDSTVVLADLWLLAGRPSKARGLYDDALKVAASLGEPVARSTSELHVGLSEIDRESGDLRAARRHLEGAAPFIERGVTTESRYRWFLAMGRIAQAEGDADAAIALLDQAELLYRPAFFPEVRPIAAMRARIWIWQGQLSQGADWARQRGVSAADELRFLREFDHLTLVRLLIAQYRARQDDESLDQASRLLGRLHGAAEESGRGGSLLEIRMLQALAHQAKGLRDVAREVLGQALREAPEPDGYARLFLDEGVPMIGLLQDAEQNGVAVDETRRMLSLHTTVGRDVPDSARRPAQPAESLSERELQVLRLLDSDLSGPQIAKELFVSHNTVRTHTKHIFTKLDVTNRRAAVRRARERGLM